ncbi:MAG: iron complex outermembrane receptor protein [Methylophagaceae bacterium]
MKSIFRPVLSGICLLSVSAYGYAEDIIFDDMTVTTTRSERSTLEVPASVLRKSGKEAKADRAVTQRELLNSIAGVRITQTGSNIGHTTSIRLPTGTKAYYLFLQDGVPVQSSGFFNHNGLAFTNFSSAGAVEVLKGAGTALYGSDAVGGTVNVISNDPMKNLGVEGSLEIGNDGFSRQSLTGGTELDEQSAISLHISNANSDGFRDNSEFDRQELSVNYVNDLNQDNTLKFALNANRFDSQMTSDIRGFRNFRDNPEAAGRNVERVLEQGIDPIRQFDYARLNAEWQHKLNDTVDLSTIVYLRSNQNRYSATWEQNVSRNDNQEKTVGLLFKADMDFGRFRVISGVDVEYTQGERETVQEFDFVPTGFGRPVAAGTIFDYDVDYRALAPYTRVEIGLSDQLTLGLGARYDINQFDYTNNTDNGVYENTYFRPDSGEDRTFNHFSPKADLNYRLTDNQTVYARYANGFRVPQVSTLYSLKSDERADSFEEEVTNTFEIGYKLRHEQHALETALYYLTIDDTIITTEVTDDLNVNVNAGKTLHAGIEVSLASQWTEQWATKVAYSFSRNEFDDSDELGRDGERLGNNEQARAPENLANVRLIYTPNALPGLFAFVEWEHIGSSWMDDENTLRYDGHDIANIKMNYEVNSHLTVFGRVNNITDRLYAESARLQFGEDYTPGAPRQAFVGLDYKI